MTRPETWRHVSLWSFKRGVPTGGAPSLSRGPPRSDQDPFCNVAALTWVLFGQWLRPLVTMDGEGSESSIPERRVDGGLVE